MRQIAKFGRVVVKAGFFSDLGGTLLPSTKYADPEHQEHRLLGPSVHKYPRGPVATLTRHGSGNRIQFGLPAIRDRLRPVAGKPGDRFDAGDRFAFEGRAQGSGVSGAARRVTGASRSSNSFSESLRGDLGPPASGTVVFLDDQDSVGLRHGARDRRHVERHEAADVDHLGLDPVGRRVVRRPPGRDGPSACWPGSSRPTPGGAQRPCPGALRNRLRGRPSPDRSTSSPCGPPCRRRAACARGR